MIFFSAAESYRMAVPTAGKGISVCLHGRADGQHEIGRTSQKTRGLQHNWCEQRRQEGLFWILDWGK